MKAFAKACENKARPTMHCNGKCQMVKEMKKEEKKEQQNSERRLTNKSETPSSKSFFASLPIQILEAISPASKNNSTSLEQGNPTGVFHPPGLA